MGARKPPRAEYQNHYQNQSKGQGRSKAFTSQRTRVGKFDFFVSIKHALSEARMLCYINAFCGNSLVPAVRHSSQISESLVMLHLLLVENVGKVASAAVLAVVHGSHEDTGAALKECQSHVPLTVRGSSQNLRCRWGTLVGDARSCRQSPPCST